MPALSTSNPLAVPPEPQADTSVDTQVTATDAPPPRVPRSTASCGFCGQAWSGEVAYCPYCGHASTGVPTSAAALTAANGDAVDQALAGHSARDGVPQGAGALRAAPEAVPSSLEQKPGSVATASAAVSGALQVVTNYVHVHAGQLRLSGTPAGPRADEPGSSWKSGWKPTVAVIAALALIAVTVDRLSETGRHPTPEATSVPASTPAAAIPPQEPTHAGPATSAQAPSTEPPPRSDRDSQPQAQASPPPTPPPAPQRSLCSAASAAAGLCNPQ